MWTNLVSFFECFFFLNWKRLSLQNNQPALFSVNISVRFLIHLKDYPTLPFKAHVLLPFDSLFGENVHYMFSFQASLFLHEIWLFSLCKVLELQFEKETWWRGGDKTIQRDNWGALGTIGIIKRITRGLKSASPTSSGWLQWFPWIVKDKILRLRNTIQIKVSLNP